MPVSRVLPWRRGRRTGSGRDGAARSARSTSVIPRRRPSSIRGPTRSRPEPTESRSAARASPTSSTRWRSPRSSPGSASTTSRSARRCCTTRSKTPRCRSPTSSATSARTSRYIVDGVTKLDRVSFDSQGAAASRHHAQDDGGHRARPARAHHQARRPPAQHVDDRGAARGETRAHRARDARHLRPARASPRHAGDQAAARGPVVRVAAPQALRRDRPDGVGPCARARAIPRSVSRRREFRLAELGIGAEITGRPKHLWSIYEKMVVKGRSFDEIYDLIGIRVIVDTVKDCYAALGSHPRHVEAGARAVQGLHRDAQVQPLPVVAHDGGGAEGKPLEVQIRTWEMNTRAEFGVAAHWEYKEKSADLRLQLVVAHRRLATGDHRPHAVHGQPQGRPRTGRGVRLHPEGQGRLAARRGNTGRLRVHHPHRCRAQVHRRAGQRATRPARHAAARRATRSRSSRPRLPGAGPSQDWLKFVVTHRAVQQDQAVENRERREDAIEHGRDELVKALRREALPVQKLLKGDLFNEILAAMNYTEAELLYAAIGEDHVSPKTVVARVQRTLRDGDPQHEEQLPRTVFQPRRPRRSRGNVGVHVEGLDDVMIRLSRCCTPVPPDEIIGFVTRGRGVSVHRSDCANAVSLSSAQNERLIDVEWDEESPAYFIASIEVKALDRGWLLRDVAGGRSPTTTSTSLVQHCHGQRPHRQDALRVRARRRVASRFGAEGDQGRRLGLRRVPRRAGSRRLNQNCL